MTREEAKAILTETQVVYFAPNGKQKAQEALDMAIEALQSTMSQERVNHESTNDLISRADALQCKPEFLNPNPNDKPNNYSIGWNDAIKVWYADIKALPSADTEPQSEQYKKGFEDAKRAFLLEYARESENMRKRNAQLEVMLNMKNIAQTVGRR